MSAPESADPYFLEDATYIKSETRWRNKQRTLVFSSRGISHRFKHLMNDVREMLPHSKAEPKFEKKQSIQEINEICELKSCNNTIYFESRKGQYVYMYVACPPMGPTIKFQVLNVHTLGELRITGNCLKGSRPLLHFDAAFDDPTKPELNLIKAVFTRAIGTPRNHPKSQPFHDHIIGLYFIDNKIWFRHYQISPVSEEFANDPERQVLTEIGPRFVLEPILMQEGSFGGKLIFKNESFESPAQILRNMKQEKMKTTINKVVDVHERKKRKRDAEMEEDALDDIFE
jgi:ribosome biogenesis protein BRX1